jgi:cytochrome c oxidase cbb3-type subunit IV
MSYETLASFAQTWGTVAFAVAFALICIYALNPANRDKFRRAASAPLRDEAPGAPAPARMEGE